MEDEHQHYEGKIVQKVLIEMDGKILVCQGLGDDIWGFPGGRLHVDEEPIDGLKRELVEDLGVDVTITGPFFVGRSLSKRDNTWRILIGWHGTLVSGTEIKVDNTEVQKYQWLTKDELKTVTLYDGGRQMANLFLRK